MDTISAAHTRTPRGEDSEASAMAPYASGDRETPRAGAALASVDHLAGGEVVVADEAMRRLYRLIDRVARGTINVLLLGETGVGKEVVAARVHAASPRASRPFVRFSCAEFSETLVESELFGHERGAFTGALAARVGLLESAQGGTVLFDEVGELPAALQVKLLRVLESRRFRRVGSNQERPLDVRVVAATHRDLEADVAAGRFRADLYFRLNGVSLVIPPLRARPAEIEALARRFVACAAARNATPVAPALSPEALAVLRSHAWPGNVRELAHVIERAVLLAWDEPITAEHLRVGRMASAGHAGDAEARRSVAPGTMEEAKEATERAYLREALARCDGHQARAASLLGISRRTLINKLDRHGLPRPRKDLRGTHDDR